MTFPIRARYLTNPMCAADQRPLPFDQSIIGSLPREIRSLTGMIQSAHPLVEGGCCQLVLLAAEQGTFILKVGRGCYRSRELWAEHNTMKLLRNSSVPVPKPLAYTRCGDLSYQLRGYSPGEPLSKVLDADESVRPDAIRQMGKLLASIHAISPTEARTWEEWIDWSLQEASRNLVSGVYDSSEFTPDQPPGIALN